MFRRVSLVWAVVCAALATGCGGGNEDKAPAAPRILSFTATPDLVDEGDEVVLAWETQNADSISIRIEGGETVELGDAAPAKGTVIVRPDGPTTYVLFAKGRGGSAESSASVAIKQPAGTLVASAEKVSWGESVELRWTTEHAEKIRLYRDDELLVQTEQPEGVHEDVPPLSGTYRLVVLRKEKQSESTLPIRVQPVVLRFEPERAGPLPLGKPEPITWEVGGAREVELGTSAGEKVVVEVEPRASGTTPLVVPQDGAFHLEARSGELSARQTTEAPVLFPPVIGSFTVDTALVSGDPGRPATVTLRWSGVERAEVLELVGEPLGAVDLAGRSLEADAIDVELTEDTSFALKATNQAGEATASVAVRVVPYPVIHRLVAAPDHVVPGETFVLDWEASGAVAQIFEDGVPLAGADALSGRLTLERHASTRFTLVVANEAGAEVEQTVALAVGPLQNLHFAAAPVYVVPGDTVTFEWENLGGRALRIRNADGEPVCESHDLAEIREGSCAVEIGLEGTHLFEYQVADAFGHELTEVAEIHASAGPRILEFSVEPAEVEVGDELLFTVDVTDDPRGNSPALTLSDGEVEYDLDDRPGLQVVAFTMSTPGAKTFTLTASTPVGTKTATAQATVYGLPEVTLSASAPAYDLENPVVLSWTSAHAASLVLYEIGADGQAPELYVVPEAERAAGSFEVRPSVATTYRMVAENPMGTQATAEVSVQIVPPAITSFVATPEIVTVHPGGTASVTLQWSAVRAQQVQLQADTLGPIDTSGQSAAGGSVTVEISSTTTFTLRASNGGGMDEQTVTVTAVPPPTIVSFTATPTIVDPPEPITLRWQVEDATQVQLVSTILPNGFMLVLPEDELQLTISENTTLTLQATNAAGHQVSTDVEVIATPARILSFEASRTYVGSREAVDISWQTVGGRSLVLEVDGKAILQTTDLGTIASHTISSTFLEDRTFHFRLAITNHRGELFEKTLSVLVSTGPLIEEFSAQPLVVEVGQPVTFSWKVRNDPNGNVPVLGLSDGEDVFDLTGADPNEDSRTFVLTNPGQRQFVLSATTSMGTKTKTYTVYVNPTVSVSLSASPQTADLENPVTLSWTSENADAGLLLLEMNDDGTLKDVLWEVPEADRAAGSFQVYPAKPTTYRLLALGAYGVEKYVDAHVDVLPPEFVDVTVFPDEVLEDGTFSLSWNAKRATEVHLGRSHPMQMIETDEPFVDISATGTPLTLQHPPLAFGYDGWADIEFPEDFRFPFGGILRDRIRVTEAGHAGFSFETIVNPAQTCSLPCWSPVGRPNNAHLAPFWTTVSTDYGPGGQILYEFGEDDRGKRLIIQWSHVGFYRNGSMGDLNFEIILWEDGAFDFRYGLMTSAYQSFHDGSEATIGYQCPEGGHFLQLSRNAAVPGGLSWRSFAFRPAQLGADGSVLLGGSVDVDEIVLTAKGPGGEAVEVVPVTVHPIAHVSVSAPSTVAANQTFEIQFWTRGVTKLQVISPVTLLPVCDFPSDPPAEGTCQITAPSYPGYYQFTVGYEGPGDQRKATGFALYVQ